MHSACHSWAENVFPCPQALELLLSKCMCNLCYYSACFSFLIHKMDIITEGMLQGFRKKISIKYMT